MCLGLKKKNFIWFRVHIQSQEAPRKVHFPGIRYLSLPERPLPQIRRYLPGTRGFLWDPWLKVWPPWLKNTWLKKTPSRGLEKNTRIRLPLYILIV